MEHCPARGGLTAAGAGLVRVSAARCARVSYLMHEGAWPERARDLALHARLLEERPLHASPGEHQALADPDLAAAAYSGNLRGWRQYRKTLAHKFVADVA